MPVARLIRSLPLCVVSLLLILCCKKGGDNPNPLGKEGKFFFSMEIAGSGTYTYGFDKSACDFVQCRLGDASFGVEMSSGSMGANKLVGSVGGRYPLFARIYGTCEAGPISSRSCMEAVFDIDTMTVGTHTGGVAILIPESFTTSGGINQNGGQDPDLSLTFNISKVGPLGGLIQGSFIGTVYNITNPIRPVVEINGSFSVQREY